MQGMHAAFKLEGNLRGQDIHSFIIEEDPFSENLISCLLVTTKTLLASNDMSNPTFRITTTRYVFRKILKAQGESNERMECIIIMTTIINDYMHASFLLNC